LEEKEIIRTTSFNPTDVSAQEFDFDDLFTYDKPQGKLRKCVEVSLPSTSGSREKERKEAFSFSHYGNGMAAGGKLNGNGAKARLDIAELYVRNQIDARRGHR
jgi:hypothetical protein